MPLDGYQNIEQANSRRPHPRGEVSSLLSSLGEHVMRMGSSKLGKFSRRLQDPRINACQEHVDSTHITICSFIRKLCLHAVPFRMRK